MTAPVRTPATPKSLTLEWIAERLAATGQLSDADRMRVLSRSGPRERHPFTVMAGMGLRTGRDDPPYWTSAALAQWLADEVELPYKHIDPLKVDVAQVTSLVSYAYAAKHHILPLEVRGGRLVLAVADPFRRDWEDDLASVLRRRIERVIADPQDLERFLVEFYALAKSVKASDAEQSHRRPGQDLENLLDLSRRKSVEANDQHVVAVVDWLLQYAFEQRASDIHLEPRRSTGTVRFRIDGILHEVYQLPPAVMAAVCSRLKILARLDVAEKRRPQDGRIKTRGAHTAEIELRLSTMPTAFGEKLVLRIFDPTTLQHDFAGLGLASADEQRWREIVSQTQGIALVTGPTGSGKTTTLYSTLRQVSRPEVNVCTIEDPIELIEPGFNQMQVNPTIDLTFADGIRTLMRQDPDIIMVGEIRDVETAEIAVQAALTGHLVLSTLHTNSAAAAITRLQDLGLPTYLIRATLLGVLAQRLARRLCRECRVPVAPDPVAWTELAGAGLPVPARVHKAVGCLECRATGYRGRVGLYELMPVSATLRGRIVDGVDAETLAAHACEEGMTTLRAAGVQAILRGETTIEEVLRVTSAT